MKKYRILLLENMSDIESQVHARHILFHSFVSHASLLADTFIIISCYREEAYNDVS